MWLKPEVKHSDLTIFLFTPHQSTLSVSGKKEQTQNWDTRSCRVNAATDWHLPALFMAGRAPFRAQRRFPPKGTYCWLRGKLSVFKSWRRCFSLKMEWTVFRKSFLLSGELKEIEGARYQFVTPEIEAHRTVSAAHKLQSAAEFNLHWKMSLPTAQLKCPLWPSLRFRLCVDNLAHSRALAIWGRHRHLHLISWIEHSRHIFWHNYWIWENTTSALQYNNSVYFVNYLYWLRTWLEGRRLGSCDGIGMGLFHLRIQRLDGSHPTIEQTNIYISPTKVCRWNEMHLNLVSFKAAFYRWPTGLILKMVHGQSNL